jgi:putative membrane protein
MPACGEQLSQFEKRGVLPMKTPLPDHLKCTEHLAVERTFLAWVRTNIAIISLGFVVAKFGVWLRELASRLDPQLQVHSTGMSLPMGIGMMAFGGILTVLAAWHCHIVHRAIERGEVRTNRGLIVAVTVAVAVLALLMIVYMLLTSQDI